MTEETNTKEAPSRTDAVNAIANQYFNNASISEALALVPFNTLIQLVKNQVVTQAKQEVGGMTDEQVEGLLKSAENVAPPEGEQ